LIFYYYYVVSKGHDVVPHIYLKNNRLSHMKMRPREGSNIHQERKKKKKLHRDIPTKKYCLFLIILGV